MMKVNADYEDLKKAQEGDKDALERTVKKHQALVVSLCKRYDHSCSSLEDLISVGNIGLLRAIQQFDFSYQVQFSTYAVPLILGEIKRFFRDDGAIKVSRMYKELYLKIEKERRKWEEEHEEPISLEWLEKQLGVHKEDLLMAMESHYYPTSLSSPLDDERLSLEDTLGENDVESALEKMDLEDALEKLDKKEQLLIRLRYFENKNQSECALRFSVSQVQISRMEKKILEKLKQLLV